MMRAKICPAEWNTLFTVARYEKILNCTRKWGGVKWGKMKKINKKVGMELLIHKKIVPLRSRLVGKLLILLNHYEQLRNRFHCHAGSL